MTFVRSFVGLFLVGRSFVFSDHVVADAAAAVAVCMCMATCSLVLHILRCVSSGPVCCCGAAGSDETAAHKQIRLPGIFVPTTAD